MSVAVHPLAPLTALARRAERHLDRWAVGSQLHARRNAMVAATALAQRRAERDEVEQYFRAIHATPGRPATRSRAAR